MTPRIEVVVSSKSDGKNATVRTETVAMTKTSPWRSHLRRGAASLDDILRLLSQHSCRLGRFFDMTGASDIGGFVLVGGEDGWRWRRCGIASFCHRRVTWHTNRGRSVQIGSKALQ